jgi:hypothetical protein
MAISKFGFDAKLYYNAATYGSPSWTLIEKVRDLTLTIEDDQVETTTRDDGGYKSHEPGLRDITVEFNMPAEPDDADWTLLHDAYIARTAKEFLVMNELVGTSGSEGIRALCHIFQGGRDEGVANRQETTFILKPAPKADAVPSWHTI